MKNSRLPPTLQYSLIFYIGPDDIVEDEDECEGPVDPAELDSDAAVDVARLNCI